MYAAAQQRFEPKRGALPSFYILRLPVLAPGPLFHSKAAGTQHSVQRPGLLSMSAAPSDEASSAVTDHPPNSRVRISGLSGRADLNGSRGPQVLSLRLCLYWHRCTCTCHSLIFVSCPPRLGPRSAQRCRSLHAPTTGLRLSRQSTKIGPRTRTEEGGRSARMRRTEPVTAYIGGHHASNVRGQEIYLDRRRLSLSHAKAIGTPLTNV